MLRFLSGRNSSLSTYIFIGVSFISVFFYFLLFNKFHLFYLEQIQLFQFSFDYFQSFTKKPGDLVFYFGEFLTQFFINPFASAFLTSVLIASVCFLLYFLFKKVGFKSVLLSFLPSVFLTALHSNHLYKIGLTVGIVLALLYIYGYLQIRKTNFRYIYGLTGWLVLFYLAGTLALYSSIFIILAEVFYYSGKARWIPAIVLLFLSVSVPYFGVKYLFYEPFNEVWFYPLPMTATYSTLIKTMLGLLVVVYLSILVIRKYRKSESFEVPVNYKTMILACILVCGAVFFIKVKAYDPKTELFLGMDHYVQTEEWNKVLKLSQRYEGVNQLVLYYTNLALYKTGQMGNHMFDYPQRGVKGLQLEWNRDEVTPFFGGEIFYHLNYINEANRWAFESMVAKGLNPRSLKRLVLTNLVNGQYKVATKYLDLLDETIYYKGWAKKYRAYVADPAKIDQDSELAQKRHFLVKNDFISLNLGLNELLREHPDNRMAFEYLMATFLLSKDIKSFADNIYRLKDLGYKEIPVNYEEALLFCMAYFKKDLVPEGFRMRNSTIQRKDQYISNIAQAGGDRNSAARNLYPQFGNTAWFYLHFADQN